MNPEKAKDSESPNLVKNNSESSPKQIPNDLSPNKNQINEKYFPSKENFFGIKTSPTLLNKSMSPNNNSPILNYFTGMSPGKLSPKDPNDSYNKNNNNSKYSPVDFNFNYSPSNYFNEKKKSSKDLMNFSLPNSGNNDEDSKPLQEKIDPFMKKSDENIFNFNRKSSDNSNNIQEPDEDDDDNNGEMFTLKFDNIEDDFLADGNKYKNIIEQNKVNKFPILNNLQNNQNQKDNNSNSSSNKKGKCSENEMESSKNQINETSNFTNQININENINNNQIPQPQNKSISLVENIINKKEFKPYIPSKYRKQYMNYDINSDQNINNNLTSEMNNLMIGNNINEQYYYQNNNFNSYNNDQFSNQMPFSDNHLYNNFYYNGDNYQISSFKEYKKKDYLKTGEIPSISAADMVTTITANNKKIKRIDPNTYLNESIEYLSYNIFLLAKDQAGCRFLQEKLEQEPEKASESFYRSIIPFVLPLVKDAFGNYLIQKLCYYLSPDKIKKFLEILAPNILDVGANNHGTRVIQHLISFLSTKELINYFLNCLKPYVIPLMKELNGTHIINKFISIYPQYADEINQIIVENCSLLATHRHGCCILQKLMDGPNKELKYKLINNLIDKCFVLIIDQFGNYVIQSILLLNEPELSGVIAMKICDNLQYYSKHRYSSNVIEKCFDYCGKKEKKCLIEKICQPGVISDLILDEHGNYVVQKALFYADEYQKEIILKYIIGMIPKIKNVSFGEKMLNRLISSYPQINSYIYSNGDVTFQDTMNSINNYNNNIKKNKKKGKKIRNKNNININDINQNNNMFNNNQVNNNYHGKSINVNNNITINNFNNMNNRMQQYININYI